MNSTEAPTLTQILDSPVLDAGGQPTMGDADVIAYLVKLSPQLDADAHAVLRHIESSNLTEAATTNRELIEHAANVVGCTATCVASPDFPDKLRVLLPDAAVKDKIVATIHWDWSMHRSWSDHNGLTVEAWGTAGRERNANTAKEIIEVVSRLGYTLDDTGRRMVTELVAIAEATIAEQNS